LPSGMASPNAREWESAIKSRLPLLSRLGQGMSSKSSFVSPESSNYRDTIVSRARNFFEKNATYRQQQYSTYEAIVK
ncbi:hypothetical protein, partial [Enterococcus faecalis]|uniref:hypothetical protein n=1 Tax=Enterococcus faecalis TaxID=1351 RepID=UPI003CC672FC